MCESAPDLAAPVDLLHMVAGTLTIMQTAQIRNDEWNPLAVYCDHLRATIERFHDIA